MSDVRTRQETDSQGFRAGYLDYAALTKQLELWAHRHPNLLRLQSLGKTPEGRDLWLATVGPEPDRLRPAVWLDANMHAAELCGSSVALALIEDLIELHLSAEKDPLGLPASVAEVAREVLFYIMPRISPDGAEAVVKTGRPLRSVPRDRRHPTPRPHWRAQDLDGDGQVLMMRYPDPAGEFVESANEPGLMLRRHIEDEGPFYQLAVEGVIENFDGVTIPAAGSFDDHFPDLNRNFPWSWAPEPDQEGAGPFATSEPEVRAVVEFASRHPNIFAWADLHTFGGVFIRPLGHAPDTEMNGNDLAIYNQIAVWAAQYTGYPTVSGFHEFTYSPNQPLRGDIVDFAYHQCGALAFTCELWNLFDQLELPKPKRFAEHYVRLGRAEHQRLFHWDREHNESRIFRQWTAVDHPQLGRVEVGGIDPRIGIWNPPEDQLDAVCRGQTELLLRLAAMAPRVRLYARERTRLGTDAWSACIVVENLGYLPSYVLDSANRAPLGLPPMLELEACDCQLASPATNRIELEHLGGWGRGMFSLQSSLLATRSSGSAGRRSISFTAHGRGSVRVRLTSPRLGRLEIEVLAPD